MTPIITLEIPQNDHTCVLFASSKMGNLMTLFGDVLMKKTRTLTCLDAPFFWNLYLHLA